MLRIFRLLLATVIVAAIVTQVALLVGRGGFNPVNFFSFFTIISNLAAATLLAVQGFKGRAVALAIRGAVTLYMAVTGVVDNVLLAGVDVQTDPWIDFIVHVVAPIGVVGDWIVDPPRSAVTPRALLGWLIFPLAYVAYSLTRGALVGWYPYPFLDPREVGGYGGVAAYSVAILVAVLGLGVALRWWANRSR
jgi:hypothetical protein